MNQKFLLSSSCLAVAALLSPLQARAALTSCSISTPALTGTYADTANLDLQGNFVINCTRSGNPKNYSLRVSLSQLASGQTMTTGYPDSLNYGVYRDSLRSNLWTSGTQTPTGASSVETPISYTGPATASSVTLTGYFRIPLGQTGKAAGAYSSSLTATVQEISATTGAVLQTFPTASFTPQATVAKSCVFGSVLPSYALNYQAFRLTALTDTTKGVDVTCTKGTSYTLALDATTAAVTTVGLVYSIMFTTSSGASVSSVSSSGLAATNYGLTLSLPGGQAGSCNAGTCTGNSIRTITVTY